MTIEVENPTPLALEGTTDLDTRVIDTVVEVVDSITIIGMVNRKAKHGKVTNSIIGMNTRESWPKLMVRRIDNGPMLKGGNFTWENRKPPATKAKEADDPIGKFDDPDISSYDAPFLVISKIDGSLN